MRILNLYAWIWWNRKLWGNEHNITAVEYDEATANVYKKLFPNDTVIIWDAHEYLLNNYKDFDFIWASPPCPTHSDIRRCWVHAGQYEALYPDMTLYQEIILLQNFAKKGTNFCIENVTPYYEPLIAPTKKLSRHLYWANFDIDHFETKAKKNEKVSTINGSDEVFGFNIKDSDIKNKRKALRNMVEPALWKHILDCAMWIPTKYSDNPSLF